ncbi:MAG: hypothetical protein KBT87_09330 [Gammaproteobacteria bacterium]|jgi:uncharacterized membrane protein|nr:hypothetical protein [Gammaproteobacteria bacterium]MBQ0774861.1 hypothetical protein [Gammaproteobacteria bacterium]|tara:strand:- start:127052 stop:127393 length:342 start_codon:yes stop_codon:yes gene_type:complete
MSATEDQQNIAKVIYILYLVSLVTGGVTAIVGVVLAYFYQDSSDEPMKDHFRFQIRTFWMALLYSFICGATIPVLIGFVFTVVLFIWMIARCVKGLNAIGRNEAPADITTWWF